MGTREISTDTFDKLVADVQDIKRAVVGNDEFGQPGLVHRVSSLEAWKDNINLRIATISGMVIGVAFILKFLFGK